MRITTFILFFLTYSGLSAQVNVQVIVAGELVEQSVLEDQLVAKNYIQNYQFHLLEEGYYFVSLDSSSFREDTLRYYVHKGEKYGKLHIQGERKSTFSRTIAGLQKDYSDNGYPFAQISIKPDGIEKGTLQGFYTVEKGPRIVFDTLKLFKPIKTRRAYLQNLLDVKEGAAFNETSYGGLERKVARSPFLEFCNKPQIEFSQGKARIYLDVEENATGQFNGLIGLQQNNAGNSMLVGNLDLLLQNLFRSGKQFEFYWNRFDENSQNLRLGYTHPLIFGTELSPIIHFSLLKQDTSFLTDEVQLGFYSYVSNLTYASFQFRGFSSTILTNDFETISQTNLIDYRLNEYSVALANNKQIKVQSFQDYLHWRTQTGWGFRNIRRNVNIPESFYDSLHTTLNTFRMEGYIRAQKKIFHPFAIFAKLEMGSYQNKEAFINELFRIGGLSTVRGFNEKQFFARDYLFNQLEFRLFFEDTSYLFLLYDQLIYRNLQIEDSPFGLGVGIALSTQSGSFNFVIASGQSQTDHISFANAKIHFGYTSTF